ncbi:protein of unknown function [Hyphomicrobium sp. 1Nfss2.1]
MGCIEVNDLAALEQRVVSDS